jgi:phenylalanyl-tRNA synthetase beta chain
MKVPIEWLKTYVPIRLKPDRLAHKLTMGGIEVEAVERAGSETIFELGVTPNRGDCLSIVGVARETAAITNKEFRTPVWKAPRGKGKVADYVRISVKHKSRCPRYCARVIDGVRIGASPAWVVKRLAASGVRSINNVVDATNYVMLETGQPLHAFDLRFVGDKKIVVRKAGENTKFTALDGSQNEIVPEDLLICDGKGPVALAGVMGGENSEVRQSTTSILLESAYFEPIGVRKTSRRLGLSSESSRRFERGVDPNGSLSVLHRLTEIILEIAGGTPTADWIDLYPKKIQPKKVRLDCADVNRILGTELDAEGMAEILESEELRVAGRGTKRMSVAKSIVVTVPTFRPDIERPIDLIEEVARIYGYHNLKETMPVVGVSPITKPRFYDQELIARHALTGAGLNETVLYGFTSEESARPFACADGNSIPLTNPLSREHGVMRTTLISGLLDVIALNVNRQRTDCRVFALQRVFFGGVGGKEPTEPRMISGAMIGNRYPGSWDAAGLPLDFYDAKGAVENLLDAFDLGGAAIYQRGEGCDFLHPGRFAYVLIGNERVGYVGQLHPDVVNKWNLECETFVFELEFEKLSELSVSMDKTFSEISRFPFVDRDLALVLEDRIPAVEVEKAIQDSGTELVNSVRIFDVYRGKGIADGCKSLGITLRFARDEATLTDNEVDASLSKILNILQEKLGASLR